MNGERGKGKGERGKVIISYFAFASLRRNTTAKPPRALPWSDRFNPFGVSCTEYYKEGRGGGGLWVLLLPRWGVNTTTILPRALPWADRFNPFGVSWVENYKEEKGEINLRGDLFTIPNKFNVFEVSYTENYKEGKGNCPERTFIHQPRALPCVRAR